MGYMGWKTVPAFERPCTPCIYNIGHIYIYIYSIRWYLAVRDEWRALALGVSQPITQNGLMMF